MCVLCGPEPANLVVDHEIGHPFELKPDTDHECLTCDQHVSVHPDKMDWLAKKEMEDIIEHGHQVRVIFDHENPNKLFAYSVGRSVKERPELLVTGPLNPTMLHYIVNRVAEIDDERGIKAGDILDEVLDGFPVNLVAVRDLEEAEMFGVTNSFGTDETYALQVLWPDMNGLFPGDEGYAYPDDAQPVYA